jgi:hypothetical protein
VSGHLDPSGRFHLGGRVRPATPHTFALARFNVNMAAIPVAPSETNFRAKSASVLGICWANGPSNASPPSRVTVGDCTTEAGYHGVAYRQGIAGTPLFVPTVEQVLATYARDSGYTGDPSTDSGCDETVVLGNAVVKGYANGDKPVAFMSVDATNVPLRGMICIETPQTCIEAIPSDAQANGTFGSPVFTWRKGPPDPTAGHCVFDADLYAGGSVIDSWGVPGEFEDDAIAELAAPESGGSYLVLLDTDILVAVITVAPDALDYRALVTTWDAEGGNVPVPGAPPASWLQIIEAALGRVL